MRTADITWQFWDTAAGRLYGQMDGKTLIAADFTPPPNGTPCQPGTTPYPRVRMDKSSAFAWAVWRAVKTIPAGQTRSYGEIARAIGHPTASRAVALALAANRIAVFIPCHRIVPAHAKDAGGYRWGKTRKEKLLRAERIHKTPLQK